MVNLLKECDQLLIWEEVHALLGEEDIVHPPIRLTQLVVVLLARVGGRTLGQLLVHRGLLGGLAQHLLLIVLGWLHV